MEVEIHATTDVGRVRRMNEDNYLLLNLSNSNSWTKANFGNGIFVKTRKFVISEEGFVLAVSDGCGGGLSGELSSTLAIESLCSLLTGEISNPDDSFYGSEIIEKLYDAALYANRLIHNYQRNNSQYGGMGATFTAAAITKDCVDFIQVGDSRGYLIRNKQIYSITKDQSLVNQLIDKGLISPKEAETHPLQNVILQALGAQNEIYPDCVRLVPQREDILLLCSDGLSNKLKDKDLLRIVLDDSADLKNACKSLVAEANLLGGEDNITVILAKLKGSDLVESKDDSVTVYPIKFPENPAEN